MQDLMALADSMGALEESSDEQLAGYEADPSMKWIVRSALQKAIRRGQVGSSIKLAYALEGIDPDYFWRSLAVIAVEDLGFANPNAVSYTTAMTLKTVRAKVPGRRSALVRMMCTQAKSRSCCELSLAVDLGHQGLLKKFSCMTTDDLLEELQSSEITSQYAALCCLRGKTPEGVGAVSHGKVALSAVEEIMQERLSNHPELAQAAIQAVRRPVDSMSLAFFPTALLALHQEELELVDETVLWPEGRVIQGMFAEAYDMHTQAGKLALKATYTSLAKLPEYAWLKEIPAQKASKALGAVVFVEEGGMVDTRVLSYDLRCLQEAQDREFLKGYGVPESRYDDARAMIRKEFPRLHDKRAWAVQLDH